jgi:hypothetical protein
VRTAVWFLKRNSPPSEQSAHHAAEQRAGATAATIVTAAPSVAAGMAGMVHRVVVGAIGGSHVGRDDLGQQRLVLQRVEVTRLRLLSRWASGESQQGPQGPDAVCFHGKK